MSGILKFGIAPKIALVVIFAAGAAFAAHALRSGPEAFRPTVPAREIGTGAPACASHADRPPQTGAFHYFHEKMNDVPPLRRILTFLLVAVLLPFATISIVKEALERSNKYNFLLLAAYTAFDIALALMLIGILLTDFWAYMLFVLAVIGSAGYNFVILTRIAEIRP